MKNHLHYAGRILRVNWLAKQQLFDFDQVEIGVAGDKTVTQFCMEIGNDMDPQRTGRYATMICTLTPEASLNTNTLNILNRTFAKVRQVA